MFKKTVQASRWSLALCSVLQASFLCAQAIEDDVGLSYGMDAELRYDDNIFRSEAREVDSTILQASPFVKATLYNNGNTYQATYRLNYAEYFDSSEDSYDDHEFALNLNHRFASKHALAASVKHSLLTEQRGSGFSEEPNILVDDPDSFDVTVYDLTYFLGAPSADMRFEVSANRNEYDFDSSYVGDSRDYKANQFGALMRYRIGARTDLLLEYRNLDVSYDNIPRDFNGQPLSLDSNEDYYLAGVAWEMTAKTKGEARIGHSSRDYDDNDFSSSDLHWEVEVSWRPKTYSEVLLNTGRASLETYGSGLFINSQKHTLSWTHAWNSRLSSRLEAGITQDDYEESVRSDDQSHFQIGLSYELFNGLRLGTGYKYHENDSNFAVVDYEQNVFYVNTSIEL
ncbi:MAG: outer membrane beta-barrel protein [Porticoccaceae bacterium]|nr:outer membrane beta-barrel protein [Porticoccaceae bacterium]